jgi:UDP-3-O-[3-hydroxymyristoyl] N-acetylglucosamine deacetylase
MDVAADKRNRGGVFMYLQRTLRHEVSCRGIGLHTGRKITMVMRPAGADEGIVFVRTDLPGKNRIKAELANVSDTLLATTLGTNGTAVSTVEHLLSAFSGMGVDNAIVEINGPEVPIMDGSALPFVTMLKEVGTKAQGRTKKFILIKKAVAVSNNDGFAKLLPAPEFTISYRIDFPHRLIGMQPYDLTVSDVTYEQQICAARTFGFLKEVEYLQAKGLALGGSLKNAIVLDDEKIINKEGLRSPDEFVKHKILDAIGDLSLLGMPFIGHFVAYKSGHHLNNLLLREVVEHKDCWEVVGNINPEHAVREIASITLQRSLTLDASPA